MGIHHSSVTIFTLIIAVVCWNAQAHIHGQDHNAYAQRYAKHHNYNVDDGLLSPPNLTVSRRSSTVLSAPGKFFNKIRETVEEHLNFDKILNQQLEVLDKFLKRAKLLPVGLRIPRISLLPDLGVLRQLFKSGRQNVRSTAVCHACRVGFALFLLKARTGIAFKELQRTAILGCQVFKIASAEVCTGMVGIYAPILQYIGNERRELTPDAFCGVVLQSYGCISFDRAYQEWTTWPHHKDEIEYDDENPVIPPNTQTLKIIHLADLHIDPHYVVGSNAVCENELCCRGAPPAKPENAAGFYGDLRKCDLPYHSFENALDHISKVHEDVDMIYMTGDLVPHDVWTTDSATNVGILRNMTYLLQKYFPRTRIVPAIGNHESHPVNMFAPHGVPGQFSVQWLYEAAADVWGQWIPAESMETFLKSGYYHTEIIPGFRVVVLNSNLCYGFNFWQLYHFRDPGNQLTWLTDVLRKARSMGEKVHIVGHLPPGQEECASVWSQNFYEIIFRFRDVVKSQFYGHTHQDEFQLYYHKENKDVAISPIWMGPSLSPFINLNPGYKVYSVDGARGTESTWRVLDFETWIYDLAKSNEAFELNPTSEPQWLPLYRATQVYELPNVLPYALDNLVQRMSTNETLFNLYYRFYFKATEGTVLEKCDQICRKRLLCNIVTPHFDGQSECMEIESGVDGVVLPKRIFEKIRTAVFAPVTKTTKKVLSFFGLG